MNEDFLRKVKKGYTKPFKEEEKEDRSEDDAPVVVQVCYEAFLCKHCEKPVINKAGLPSKRFVHEVCDLKSFDKILRNKII